MDASQITKLLQKQNTRYINRCQTVDSSTLTWQNQIQSSKYIKGVKTCDGAQNTNVPTNPCCANETSINGVVQRTGTYSFGGSGRTTSLQTGSPQHYLNVLSGAAGSAAEVYSSERILLQQAGKESCGVPGTNPAPQNSYVVLPACYCVNTNGPTNSVSSELSNPSVPGNPSNIPINNQSNPYLPPFDTYYAMKNPSALCTKPIPDQNQKHFVPQCIQCPGETPVPIGAFIPNTLYTLEPPPVALSISYEIPEFCAADILADYPVSFGPGTPVGGIFVLTPPPGGPYTNLPTINPVTGTISINPNPAIDALGTYTVTYTVGNSSASTQVSITGGC